MPLVDVRNLARRFGDVRAVEDVSFAVDAGEVVGFLGPNGAGKSTTMKMVTGFLPPTSGTAVLFGHDVTKDPLAVKRRVGYLPEGAPAYGDMTAGAFLEFVADLRGLTGKLKRERLAQAVERLSLAEVWNRRVETLSKGFKRRVGLAHTLLHDPEVLILDEPTDGLDPNQKHEVRELIRSMAGQKAIIVSTHILEEVEAVCSRAIIIAKGRVLADSTPADLLARSRRHNAVVATVPAGAHEAAIRLLGSHPAVARVEVEGHVNGVANLVAYPANGHLILPEVGQALASHAVPVAELRAERGRLDEVFREITQGQG